METIARVRRDDHVHHKPIRQIARERGLSRNTVRKILRTDATAFSYERERQPLPRLGGHVVALERMLEENQSKSRRERLTVMRMFELLRAEGYGGGYDAVRRHARRWRAERVSAATGVFIPLYFAPGEADQFDWSHEIVVLGRVTTTVKVAHVRLCHSRTFLVACYPRETQEMVFDAHDRAFRFFGGSCRRGIYDNMSTAVDAVFAGKERRFNRRFEQLCSHHLVEPVACTPAAGWEKGQVENRVGNVRERFFTPRPRFGSLEELNSWLDEQCRRKMAALARKPGALRNGAPFCDWDLPPGLASVRRRLGAVTKPTGTSSPSSPPWWSTGWNPSRPLASMRWPAGPAPPR